MDLLKLAALDADDLETISAHLQDAVIRVGEMAYLPRERQFAMLLDRFDWLAAASDPPQFHRRRAGLQVHRVLHAATRGFSLGETGRQLNLLAVTFTPGEPPSGTITLLLSSEAAVRLDVECIEAALSDLGPEWEAVEAPSHDGGQ